ncbi:MAG: ribonuclease J [Bdellovibrionota bacterium]
MNKFSWSPLGGLGEVGMNCMVFKFGDQIVPVDAGVLFADPNNYGVDAVYPDYRKLLQQGVKTWLITHGHEDHVGAAAAVFHLCRQMEIEPPQFYAPPLAHSLINQKLSDSRYSGLQKYKEYVHLVEPGTELNFGELNVKFIEIRHSTPTSCSLAFKWRDLCALHTADFKLDYNEFEDGLIAVKDFDVFDGKRPDLLFLDSTNADRSGQSISEADIKEHLEEVIKTTPGRLFVTLFSSNVYRIALIASLAEKNDRKVCLAGRAMRQTYHAARSLGIFEKCPPFSESTFIEPEESVNLDPKKVLIICSGSQGEFRSVLSKIASANHPVFRATENDTVLFSSKMIPGNERTIMRLIDGLMGHNVKVLWGEKAEEEIGGPIHASGHGRSEELKELVRFLKPKKVIPVHGALHQLKATEALVHEVSSELDLNIETTVTLNNSRLEFEKKEEWELVDHYFESIPQEKFLRFENFDSPSRDPFLKARKFAADGGCLSVVVHSPGRIDIELKGILPENYVFAANYSHEKLNGDLRAWMNNKLKGLEKNNEFKSGRFDGIKAECEDEMARMVRKITGSKPLVFVHFI